MDITGEQRLKYISRTKLGWMVKVRIPKKNLRKFFRPTFVQKHFSDSTFGGMDNCLVVAKMFRDAAHARLIKKSKNYQLSSNDRLGRNNPMSKVCEDDVVQIRKMKREGYTLREIVEHRLQNGLVRLSLRCIAKIVTGETWGHIPGKLEKRWIRGTRGYSKPRQQTIIGDSLDLLD